MSMASIESAPKTRRKKVDMPFYLMATCTVQQACAGTGLGRSFIYDLINEDIVESQRVKGRRVLNVPSLLKAVGFKPPSEPAEAH